MAFFSSCISETNQSNMKIDKNKVIAYNTEDFIEWENLKKIKIEEAFILHYAMF